MRDFCRGARAPRIGASLLAGFAVAGLPLGNAVAKWLRPRTLSVPGHVAIYPRGVIDDLGHASAVWADDPGPGALYHVAAAREQSAATAWSRPLQLSRSGQSGEFPQIAANGRLIVALWEQGFTRYESSPPSVPLISSSFSTWRASAWSRRSPVSPAGRSGVQPQVALDGRGRATAVWASNTPISAIEVATGTSRGWGPPTRLDGRDARLPQIALNARGAGVAVWLRPRGGSFIGGLIDTVVASSKTPTGRWSRPQVLGPEYEPGLENSASFEFAGPRVAINAAGDAAVVWQQRAGPETVVPVALIRRSGGGWTEPRAITPTGALNPHVALSAHAATVVWIGPNQSVVTSRRALARRCGWKTPTQLFAGNPIIDPYPQIASDEAGDTIIGWSGRPAEAVVRARGARHWSRPTVVARNGLPQVTLNQHGDALVLVQHSARRYIAVSARRYIAPSPAAPIRVRTACSSP